MYDLMSLPGMEELKTMHIRTHFHDSFDVYNILLAKEM